MHTLSLQLSLGKYGELVPGPPSDTKIHGCSSLVYKMAQNNAHCQCVSTDSQPQIKNTTGYKTHEGWRANYIIGKIFYAITSNTE